MKKNQPSTIRLTFCAALLVTLAGCVHGPKQYAVSSAPPPPDYVESDVVVLREDYVYYPGYEVYCSVHRREYVYRDGPSWVTRSAPPRVLADVLLASPSVSLDFHDSPSIHHAAVVRQYPKHWTSPGSGSQPGQASNRPNLSAGRFP